MLREGKNVSRTKRFPEGFFWGAATASYQVEGGIDNTDWATAAKEGRVPVAGDSGDHFNRYEEDFDIAKALSHNAHRFSIEWARVEPKEGVFDPDAIRHYREVLKALHSRSITPFITLWHFTLPTWFSEKGGFESEESVEIFARYCEYVVGELGDLCEHFTTINEPNVYASHGWLFGAWPPFKRTRILWKTIGKHDGTDDRTQACVRFVHLFDYLKVVKHLVSAHNLAYTKIKKKNKQVQVSIVKHVHVFESNWNPFNKFLAYVMRYLQTYHFMNKVIDCCDAVGLNYYRHTTFGDTRNYFLTDMKWKAYPSGIYRALKTLAVYQKPIFISEAGVADWDDDIRGEYIQTQVRATWEAVNEGVDVRAHMYWSLLDNYEWALGYEKRFGLVEIDYKTLERKIRPSAYLYKKICEENAVD
jgi:beta-glucosidase